MTNKWKAHHHYKGDNLSRSEKVEKKVVELILNSKIPDNQREDSLVFALKHTSGCCQIARILAQKRNLDVEKAEIIAVLHDIYVTQEGTYQKHANKGADVAEKILREIGGFNDKEITMIKEAVFHHSEKDIWTDNPYVELIKDVDVFECSLYKGAEGDYRVNKPDNIIQEYEKRIKKVRLELSLNPDQVWRE